MAASRDQNIGGLDIAVDDSFGVGGVESISNVGSELEQDFGLQRVAYDGVF